MLHIGNIHFLSAPFHLGEMARLRTIYTICTLLLCKIHKLGCSNEDT